MVRGDQGKVRAGRGLSGDQGKFRAGRGLSGDQGKVRAGRGLSGDQRKVRAGRGLSGDFLECKGKSVNSQVFISMKTFGPGEMLIIQLLLYYTLIKYSL